MIAIIDRKGLYRAFTLWQRIVISTVWTLGLVGVGWMTWCALDRDLPVEAEAVDAAPVIVAAGQTVDVTFRVERRRVCSSRGESVIIDAAGIRWPFEPTPWRVIDDKLGADKIVARFTVPPRASPGVARYRLVYYQRCPFNPVHMLWPIIDITTDVTFEIIR